MDSTDTVSDAPSPGRRERRKAETRAALLNAAYELFLAQGFDSVTMDDVAQAANVSRRTAFRYFPTKEALVFPLRSERLAHFRALLKAPQAQETSFETVRRSCLTVGRSYEAETEAYLQQEQIVKGSSHLLAFERVLDRDWEEAIGQTLSREERSERGRRRARILAVGIFGLIRGVLREWGASECRLDLQKLAREAFDRIEEGVGETD